ncbi:DUF5789 family protein [Halocatena pleomorpha]|uniref:DUF2795 domain-containing protein n=1 Tax=Halocatena pleomorpha TaxID=1785090 RepID=A0A3P3RDK7_9EURY|nr:hypothetical protein [Halocatena pleomorpha]RRJ31546.1 hypothetical protein EIK79_07485 [Halocatena pleomorpha]
MGHSDQETGTVRSLEMRDVNELFENTTFPTTTEDILREFGSVEVEYPRGSDPLRAILERSGHETYTSRNALATAILNGVRRDAVGRPRYSDRGDERNELFDRPIQSF